MTRTIEAASTGTATRKPAWMGVSEICLEMKGASGPNITLGRRVARYQPMTANKVAEVDWIHG